MASLLVIFFLLPKYIVGRDRVNFQERIRLLSWAISDNMHTRPDSRSLEERINKIRVENSACKKFVPETELYEILSRESIAPLIGDFTPFHYAKEVVDFIVNNARKTFSILILINRIHYIGHFIKNDDFQARHIDDLLPFTKERLHHILEDDHMVEMFYERQWEFTAPMFLGQLVPRALSKYTILPFLAESHLAKGGYGSIYKTEIHPSHRPPNSTTTIVKSYSRSEA